MENDVQLVACVVNSEEHAIDIRNVQEIIRVLNITRVPNASHFIIGVINLRGIVIPVMNLRRILGLPENTLDESARIVILNWQGLLAGVLVDGVTEVVRLPRQDIEYPPSVSTNIDYSFFSGIGKLGHRMLIILNLDKIFEIT